MASQLKLSFVLLKLFCSSIFHFNIYTELPLTFKTLWININGYLIMTSVKVCPFFKLMIMLFLNTDQEGTKRR